MAEDLHQTRRPPLGAGGSAAAPARARGRLLAVLVAVALVASMIAGVPPFRAGTAAAAQPPSQQAEDVGAGAAYTCAVRVDGSLSCWGFGSTTPPAGSYTAVSVGYDRACAIKVDGSLACWGAGGTPAGTYTDVSAGEGHSCGVRTDGTLACWGDNGSGESNPPSGTYTDVTAGAKHSCAVATDETITCWGRTAEGQSTVPAGTYHAVSAGNAHTCAIKTDDTLACWGDDTFQQIQGVPAGAFDTLSAGDYHTCAIKTDQTVACWGNGDYGQLAAPTGTFLALDGGFVHTCAVTTERTVECWGTEQYGAFGAAPAAPGGTPPAGNLGSPYSFAFTSDTGTPAGDFAVTSGALPPGLTLSPEGVLSGTPTTTGIGFGFWVTATNLIGREAAHFTITIYPELTETTTTLESSANPSLAGDTVTFTATVSSATEGTVSFADGGTVIAGCEAQTLTDGAATCEASLDWGSHSVTASYSGTNFYAASTSASLAQLVRRATTTTISSSSNPVTVGDDYVLTATVTPIPSGGTITFVEGSTPLDKCSAVPVETDGTAQCVPRLAVGSHPIHAAFSGADTEAASQSTVLNLLIRTGTTTAISSSANPSLDGDTVTFTATVDPTPDGGTVTFDLDDSPIAGCGAVTVSGGTAACAVALVAGTHSIRATYSGTTTYAASSKDYSQDVLDRVATTTVVSSSVNPSNDGDTVTFTATVDPDPGGGTVAFTDGGSTITGCSAAAVSGGVATCAVALAGGTHTITATFGGSGVHDASTSSPLSQTVMIPTTGSLSSSSNPSAVGETVTLTVTITPEPSGGTAAFYSDDEAISGCSAVPVSGGTATCQAAFTAGSHAVYALYSGAGVYHPSTSSGLTQSTLVQTSIALTTSPNPSVAGETVTVTATIAPEPDGGTVAFADGGTTIAGCGTIAVTSGIATCEVALAAGDHPITAAYSGTGTHDGGTSSVVHQIVLVPTTTVVTTSKNPSLDGETVVLTATVDPSPDGGTVAFVDGGSPVSGCGTVAVTSGVATCDVTLAGGDHAITAAFSGSGAHAGSQSPELVQHVLLVTSTAVSTSANPAAAGATVVFTATVTPDPSGGTVSFTDDGSPIIGCDAVAVSDGSAACSAALPAGEHSITATFSGTATHGASTSAVTQTVLAPPTIEVVDGATNQTVQYSDGVETVTVRSEDTNAGGSAPALTATGLPSGLTFTDAGDGTGSLAGRALSPAGVYPITITSTSSISGVVQTASVTVQVTVEPEQAVIAFAPSNPAAEQVSTDGGTLSVVAFAATIRERQPDEAAGAAEPGELANASFSMSLVPVGPGTPLAATCTGDPIEVASDGYQSQTIHCTFTDIPVNVYELEATVGEVASGSFFAGSAGDVFSVFDPSLGYTTGGGSFLWPGTSDLVNFGYVMQYNKKQTNMRGGLLLIRHRSDGTIDRVKSNALEGLALGSEGKGADAYGWASFTGKATFRDPSMAESVGNHQFTVYVEDHGTPGIGVDEFWIDVRDPEGAATTLSMLAPAGDNCASLTGGNVFVPIGSSKGGKRR